MSKKSARLEMVKMVISSQEIGTQDELMMALQQSGVRCTQATLSRDLKEMRVMKVMGAGGAQNFLQEEYKLTAADIVAAAKKAVSRK